MRNPASPKAAPAHLAHQHGPSYPHDSPSNPALSGGSLGYAGLDTYSCAGQVTKQRP